MRLLELTRRRLLQAATAAGLGAWAGTAKAEPSALAFLAVGDWGRDGLFNQRDVAAGMGAVAAELAASFVVSVGDNFYPHGVRTASDAQWRSSFEDIYTAPSLQVPWWAILGNHDHHGRIDAQIEYARTSPRWRMPALHYATSARAPDGATVELFFLDTTPMARESREEGDPAAPEGVHVGQDQLDWLDKALARSTADWKLVAGHHPIYSGGHHGDTQELISRLKPILERHGVQAYLNGHDHDQQDIQVGKLRYLTTGAGAKTRPAMAREGTLFFGDRPGFLAVQLDRTSLRFSFRDAGGAVLYRSQIDRTA